MDAWLGGMRLMHLPSVGEYAKCIRDVSSCWPSVGVIGKLAYDSMRNDDTVINAPLFWFGTVSKYLADVYKAQMAYARKTWTETDDEAHRCFPELVNFSALTTIGEVRPPAAPYDEYIRARLEKYGDPLHMMQVEMGKAAVSYGGTFLLCDPEYGRKNQVDRFASHGMFGSSAWTRPATLFYPATEELRARGVDVRLIEILSDDWRHPSNIVLRLERAWEEDRALNQPDEMANIPEWVKEKRLIYIDGARDCHWEQGLDYFTEGCFKPSGRRCLPPRPLRDGCREGGTTRPVPDSFRRRLARLCGASLRARGGPRRRPHFGDPVR